MTSCNPPRPWTRSYAEGVPADLEPVTGCLTDLMAASARDYPDAPALEFFGRVTTYRTMQDQIDRVAGALHDSGVRAGDTVAIVLPNCPQHIVAFYAVLRLGAIAIEHNPLYTPGELLKQFEDHGAKTAIVWSNVVATVQEFPRDLAVRNLISVDVVQAMPAVMRLALRLPVPKLRESRAALTTLGSQRHAVEDADRPRAAPGIPPGTCHRRSGDHPVHERNHRHAEGCRPHPPQPVVECGAGAGVGSYHHGG